MSRPSNDQAPSIAIYADHLLPASATFIREQGGALQRFKPVYAGSRRVDGLSLPDEDCYVINKNRSVAERIGEALFLALGACGQISRPLARRNPLLIHAHFGPDGVSAMPLARALGVPLMVTFHGYDVTTKDEYARKSFYRHRKYLRKRDELKSFAHRFIAVSRFIQDRMIGAGFPADKIVQHYIGIDVEKFEEDTSIRRDNVVLFVGRLVEKKGCEYLLRACHKSASDHDFKVVVIGDGELRTELERLAVSLKLDANFLGVQPPERVKEWMNRARVFCVPSLIAESGDAEAFGMVFAEAQAMGLPVVSSLSGGIPEVVRHGETGLLAAERDVDELAAHLSQLLSNDGLWEQFSDLGKKHVRDRFDIRRQTALLEEIYQEVIQVS
ncbi:MAG: glycosyltransferase [Rhodothermia bacterium]|nr:glycosyltransferase [Rhodothermia bacterium]